MSLKSWEVVWEWVLRAGRRSGNESKELESSLRMPIPHSYITVQKNVWLPGAVVT